MFNLYPHRLFNTILILCIDVLLFLMFEIDLAQYNLHNCFSTLEFSTSGCLAHVLKLETFV